ncbi:uncharacterized protein LOC131673175 [Phymastichus coffea]|uniref:uncharacterized protein LOC131673175 n=1 Tax=Phymastichus coffea TaxID=108790 RepID=UPI00273BA6C0|nr:uncharacterized protein LOC131673175 [Phymastichus coffea]
MNKSDSWKAQMTTTNGNRKRPLPMPLYHHHNESSSQHFDLIKYIHESWNSVTKELDDCQNQQHGNSSNNSSSGLVTYYREYEPSSRLKGFEPFNLETTRNLQGVHSIVRNSSSETWMTKKRIL